MKLIKQFSCASQHRSCYRFLPQFVKHLFHKLPAVSDDVFFSVLQKLQSSKESAHIYAVQCGRCSKWRVVPTNEDYETIRENFIEDPWFCEKNRGVTCDDPADIEYDNTRLWVIDKPNIPKTPSTTKRNLTLRKDLSKFDAHYIMPNGKKVRSTAEVERFLVAHPEYKDQMSVSDFSFTSPKIMEDMVPRNIAVKASPGGSNKKMRR